MNETTEAKKRIIDAMVNIAVKQLIGFYPVDDDLIRNVVRNVFGEFASLENERRVKAKLDFLSENGSAVTTG